MLWKTFRRAAFFWSFVLLSAYLVYVYPIQRLTQWLGHPTLLDLYSIVGLWLFVTAVLWWSFRRSSRLLELALYNWMGIGFVFFSLCLVYDLFRLGFALDDYAAAMGIILVGTSLVAYAFTTAQHLSRKDLKIHASILKRDYRLVQISDVHVGSRSATFLKKIVDTINAQHPDIVLITGDFLDSGRVGPNDIAALKDLQAPVYLSIGNHERYAGLDRAVPLLEGAGVIVLRNRSVSLDGLQLIGIDDAEDKDQVRRELANIELEPACFKVLLYHRPLGWDAAVDSGIDLMLCGHTHNGQIFPFNWLVRQQFRIIRGLHSRGNCRLYVSPGTGTWGPAMRLGSRNEITCIDLVANG